MYINNLRVVFTLLFILISTSAFADHNIIKELESGKSIVLIINANEKSKSEQYADWSHYLNEFSSGDGKNYIFYKVSTAKLKKIILNGERFKENYSMIFMKKGKPSYFYSGAIVEAQVYKFVRLSYLGKPIKPKYLNQFSPKKVHIELNKCN